MSLIGTFAFVKLFGFSINTLTLFGIVLATGIVVDDAIVVIENIERHMREYEQVGRTGRPSTPCARCSGAVIVIGIVLVAVFVPVAFFPGTTGRLYQQFSLTIAFAVVLSVFNAVTLTPALSALLLDKESHTPRPVLHAPSTASSTRGTASTSPACARALALAAADARRCSSLGLLRDLVACIEDRALGLRARGGRGLLHHPRAGPAGASLEYTDEDRQAGRADPAQGPRHPGGLLGDGLQLQRRGARTTA